MVWTDIIVAALALLGTAIGSFSGFKLTSYRVEQLEKKVDKHNSVVERTCRLEGRMTEAEHDIRDIKNKA